MPDNREKIRGSMLKTAARLWGQTESEQESNFDPLVSLLLGACAVELDKFTNEIQASRARILQNLVQLLLPEALTGPLPAHAIATALPVERTTELDEKTQFYRPGKKEIYFSPTGNFRLNKASVRFMVAAGAVHSMDISYNKELVAVSRLPLPASRVWLGIDEPHTSLGGTQFYFGLAANSERQLFYHHLPRAEWSIDGIILTHHSGYQSGDISGETVTLSSVSGDQRGIGSRAKSFVNSFYKHSFVTLTDDHGITAKKCSSTMPSELSGAFSEATLALLNEQPLRWISLQFPESITDSLLQNLTITMNCFPVINRRLHEVNHRMQDITNIIPLDSEDELLDIQEVTDESGGRYLTLPSPAEDDEPLTVQLWKGGVARFDDRDAAAMTDQLLQLLRDECAAFSSLDREFIGGEIRQLQQVIRRLEQALATRNLRAAPKPYLVVRQRRNTAKHLFVKYWSTVGAKSNDCKAGSILQLYQGTATEGNRVVLVSPSQGGRDRLSLSDSVLAWRSALLSKDRLVTAEDIKAFCQYQLSHRMKKLDIRRGVMIPVGDRQGLARVVDVIVTWHSWHVTDDNEIAERAFWEENLRLLLTERSSPLVQYRVTII
jgi:hypothetical protein